MEKPEQHDSSIKTWTAIETPCGQGFEGPSLRPPVEEDPLTVSALSLLRGGDF